MSKPIFLLIAASPNPDNMEALQGYLSQTPAISKKYGAVTIATYDIDTVLDSGEKPANFLVISFPDRDSISGLFNDPDYQALIPLREQGFKSIRYFIANEQVEATGETS